MIDLSATNPFPSGSQEYLAYQRAYVFASANQWEEYNSMCGRVIGHMLRELPWDGGRSKMASEVNSCANDESLLNLGTFYINHFLRAFRGSTPTPSEHSSCPSFDDDRDMNSDVTKAPQDHHTARSQALKRDGYRCMLSGKLDVNTHLELLRSIDAAALAVTEAQDAAAASTSAPLDLALSKRATTLVKRSAKLHTVAQRATTFLASVQYPTVVTNAAHIFPESTNAGIGGDAQRDYASSVWAVMERFGQNEFRDELDGTKIHRLTNILTLDHLLHTLFNKLLLWLETDDTLPHTYRLCAKYDCLIKHLPSSITFTSQHPAFTTSDLPDRRYIQIHAACCRVAHMSGAAHHLDDIMDDLEKGQTKVLSADGSSSRILEFALLESRAPRIARTAY